MRVTNRERGIISLVRLNKLFLMESIVKRWETKQFVIKFEWRSKKNLWGRFGGGWNWMLGIQAGSTTVIINLLFCSISFWIKKTVRKESD